VTDPCGRSPPKACPARLSARRMTRGFVAKKANINFERPPHAFSLLLLAAGALKKLITPGRCCGARAVD